MYIEGAGIAELRSQEVSKMSIRYVNKSQPLTLAEHTIGGYICSTVKFEIPKMGTPPRTRH